MQEKNEERKIAVLLLQVEYTAIPFARLEQLAEVGLTTIYLLLNEEEYFEAMHRPVNPFGEGPQSILEYYQASKQLNIHLINTGTASTTEAKLDFYLNTVNENYLLNLVLCKEPCELACQALTAKPFITRVTSYPLLPFFNTSEKQIPEPPLKARFDNKSLDLLTRENNPCLCYPMATFDLIHHQWLYNIFIELNNHFSNHDLDGFYAQYKENIKELEQAEERFYESHKTAHGNLQPNPDEQQWLSYQRQLSQLTALRAAFPNLINQLIDSYERNQQSHSASISLL